MVWYRYPLPLPSVRNFTNPVTGHYGHVYWDNALFFANFSPIVQLLHLKRPNNGRKRGQIIICLRWVRKCLPHPLPYYAMLLLGNPLWVLLWGHDGQDAPTIMKCTFTPWHFNLVLIGVISSRQNKLIDEFPSFPREFRFYYIYYDLSLLISPLSFFLHLISFKLKS